MNIKVKRIALIKALQKALKARLDGKAAFDKAEKAYKEEVVAFEAKILEAVANGKVKVTSVSINNWRYNDEVRASIEVVLPKSWKNPERTDTPSFSTHQIAELENAIAILNISDEEFVSASTYKSVSQYIS